MRHAVLVRQAEAQGCPAVGRRDAEGGGEEPPHVICVLHSFFRRELVADRLQGLGFAS
ncbi:hypothetical protein DIPPA_22613 [Diplonema papillatum]|nr:hypothetical protein DIPPA_22613 [Diplonema papillatum]